ncbi:MAG: CPBP family intramembrane glutamic endopeptidase [Steroidobacteraceae bacterium]
MRQLLRDSRWLTAVDFALVAAVFIADANHRIYLSKTPYLLALGWLSLRLRGLRWRDVGLRLDRGWQRLALIGLAVGVAMELLELLATQPLLVAVTGRYPDLSALHGLIGNVPQLVLVVGASWVVAGLGEELVWRGYALNRAADLFGRSRWGWAVSLVLVSSVFGAAHAYQGITGVAENSIDGALLAGLYLGCRRNLIAPIVAHAVTDTLDALIVFSGCYPGMS